MKRIEVTLVVLVVTLCILGLVPRAEAQNPNLVPRSTPITVGTDSETWKSEISYLSQSLKEDEAVILIASLGNKEKSRSLNRQRLQVARLYLHISRGLEPRLKDNNIVTAESGRTRGEGRIEAYVRGKLFMIFVFRRNKNFAPEP